MAAQIPIKVMKDGSDNTCGLAQFSSSDNLPVSVGGTGLTTQGICAFAQPGINAVACKTTYIGICAGKSEGAADENTYVGYGAGQNVTTGCSHTMIGSGAGDAITTCHGSVLVGLNAGGAITFGDFNTIIGMAAGSDMTTASNNTAFGYRAITATICSNNVAIGTCAMVANTQGQDNVAIGLKAGATQVAAACNNTFIGSCVGAVALCRDNTLVGAHAGIAQTTATCNVMLGGCVGYGVVGGAGNVYLGYKSGLVNTSGNDNVFIGKASGVASTASCCLIIGNGTCDIITGDFNTASIGLNAPIYTTLTVGVDDTGYDVTFFGATSGCKFLWDETDNRAIIIGNVGIGTTAPAELLHVEGNMQVSRCSTVTADAPAACVTANLGTSAFSADTCAAAGWSFAAMASKRIDTGLTSAQGGNHVLVGQYFGLGMIDNDGGTGITSVMSDAARDNSFVIKSIGGTADTTKTTAALGLIQFDIAEHDGANALDNITADGNIFAIRAYTGGSYSTKFWLDEDGDGWFGGSLQATDSMTVCGSALTLGASVFCNTLTVGVDDTGYDVKFFGATSGCYFLWDETDNRAIIMGNVGIGTTAPAVPLEITKTTEQLRLSYDSGTSTKITTADTGVLTICPSNVQRVNFSHGISVGGYSCGNSCFMNGCVGIGTASPNTVLQVEGDTSISNGYGLIVGHTSQVNIGGVVPEAQVLGTGGADSQLALGMFSTGGGGPQLTFVRSRNGTIGSNTIVQDGDPVVQIAGYADDGTDYVSSVGHIGIAIDGTPGSNDTPGRITFSTTPDGAEAVVERMRIDNAGNVGIGTITPERTLDVRGDVVIGDRSTNSCISLTDSGGAIRGIIRTNSTMMELDSDSAIRWYPNNAFAMSLDASGDLGIGTTAPDDLLHVWGSDAGAESVIAGINVVSEGTSTSGYGVLVGDSGTGFLTFDAPSGTNGGNYIAWTYNSGAPKMTFANHNVDVMAFDSSGFVGIGTAAPNAHLHISRAGDAVYPAIHLEKTSLMNHYIGYDTEENLVITENVDMVSSVRFGMSTGGDVAIGRKEPTISANAAPVFSIEGTNPAFSMIDSDNAIDYIMVSLGSGSANWYYDDAAATTWSTATASTGAGAVERMRLTSGGNVGIGTAAPRGNLHISTSALGGGSVDPDSDYDELVIEDALWAGVSILSCSAGGVLFGDAANTSIGSIKYWHGTNYMTFNANAAERMRIDCSGNVGIGTTAPGKTFEVLSTTAADFGAAIRHTAADGNGLLITAGVDSGDFALRVMTCAGATDLLTVLGSGTVEANGAIIADGTATSTGYQLTNAADNANTVRLYNNGVDDTVLLPGKSGGNVIVNSFGNAATIFTITNAGNVTISGSLSKGSGSFRIDHPLEAKKDTHELVHSFIEGPQADLIYRGVIELTDGSAEINVDTVSGMTEGTFVALNRCVQAFTNNESNWDNVRGSVTGNTLTIESNDSTSTASISWMVIGERCDKHMMDTDWTDDDGKVIVEPVKDIVEPAPPE